MTEGNLPVDSALDERAQHFLKILIERYIREGDPVGSRTLAREVDLSPATIRNVMSDLEDCGLIVSPHASAGRVPTATGYRLFVDSMLSLQPVDESDLQRFRSEFEIESDNPQLLEAASRILSHFTNLAGVVMVPRQQQTRFRQIEFLPLSENRILVILVTADGEVVNHIINPKRKFSPAELEQSANYLNHLFSGREMHEVRSSLLRDLGETRKNMDRLMAEAIELAEQAFQENDPSGDYVISGQTNLMDFNELADTNKLRSLFDAFTEKSAILSLLDECMNADGIQIFIGEESGYKPFDDCSVIATPYTRDNQVVGVLAVIGPTRLAYNKVIPIVDVTAKLLSAALKH